MKMLKFITDVCTPSKLNHVEQKHSAECLYDETVKLGFGRKLKRNGFREGYEGNYAYYVGFSVYSFGIPVQDILLKFKSKALYDHFLAMNSDDVLATIKSESRMNTFSGTLINMTFVFNYDDSATAFNIKLSTDFYSEER